MRRSPIFYEGLGQEQPRQATPHQRMLLEIARNFAEIQNEKHQESVQPIGSRARRPLTFRRPVSTVGRKSEAYSAVPRHEWRNALRFAALRMAAGPRP